jgi:hypothetical protein
MNEKVIEKIKKLLNTANDKGATENEAMIAALKAQELMAKYDISITDVEDDDNSDEIVTEEYETGTGNKWKYILSEIVANNFCCKTYNINKTRIVFYGYKRHSVIAKDVFKMLYETGNRLAMRYYQRRKNNGEDTKGFKNQFLLGYVQGIKFVLDKQCTALMIVTPKEVVSSFDNLTSNAGFKTQRCTIKHNIDEQAREEGYNEGRKVAQARYLEG